MVGIATQQALVQHMSPRPRHSTCLMPSVGSLYEHQFNVNNEYTIIIKAPLLRPGLIIKTKCSEKYVGRVLEATMNIVRQYNAKEMKQGKESQTEHGKSE